MKTPRYKRFFDEVYAAEVYVFCDSDTESIRRFINKRFVDMMGNLDRRCDDDFFNTEACCLYCYRRVSKRWKKHVYVVHFARRPTLGTLSHEIFHLTDMIQNHRGVLTYENSNNEHAAYYIDYWTRHIGAFVFKKRKGRSGQRP